MYVHLKTFGYPITGRHYLFREYINSLNEWKCHEYPLWHTFKTFNIIFYKYSLNAYNESTLVHFRIIAYPAFSNLHSNGWEHF